MTYRTIFDIAPRFIEKVLVQGKYKVHVRDEYSSLKKVVVGKAESFGGIPDDPYDPKSKEHIQKGTFPKESDLKDEIEGFVALLEKHGVEVYRPHTIENLNQIYSRDVAFVIEDKLVIANMIADRSPELQAIDHIFDELAEKSIVHAPDDVRFEGGDVMPHRNIIFMGYEEEEDFRKYKVSRTNRAGVEFIRELFPEKEVLAFELNKSDENPRENALHLDCCFQPLGLGHCLIYRGGFKNEADYFLLKDLFGAEKCIDISQEEMYHMGSNVFSISKDVVVSEAGQTRINTRLRELGYIVEELKYSEVSKMEGLFRCSTLPLLREND